MEAKIRSSYVESVFHYLTVTLDNGKKIEVQAVTDEHEVRDIFPPKHEDLSGEDIDRIEKVVTDLLSNSKHPNIELSIITQELKDK